jgi:hypothetical protein
MHRLLVALGLLVLAVRPSLAGTATYQFTGVCTDCSGDVTAQLALQDYTPGTDIWSAFVRTQGNHSGFPVLGLWLRATK